MKLAIIRIRGIHHVNSQVADTLTMLGLRVKNNCVIKESTPQLLGMINKVKDYSTWGPINEETLKAIEKTKKTLGKKTIYTLHPPRKGYGKKGIKVQYKTGGALGDRGEKINELIMKMLPESVGATNAHRNGKTTSAVSPKGPTPSHAYTANEKARETSGAHTVL